VLSSDDTLTYHSPTWKVMSEEHSAGGQKLLTLPSDDPKYAFDQIWWDYDGGKKKASAFVDGPHRSADFGSDHRFAWATVTFR
jgi:hypothetical protein